MSTYFFPMNCLKYGLRREDTNITNTDGRECALKDGNKRIIICVSVADKNR